MKKKPAKPSLPPFADADEEAAWLRENSKFPDKVLRAALKSGEGKNLGMRMATIVERLFPGGRPGSGPKASRAKGLPYQTYIKSLLHHIASNPFTWP
jgi:hypothetical protein